MLTKLRRRTSEGDGEGGGVGEACAHSRAAALLCEVKLDPRRPTHARVLRMHLVVGTSLTCWVSVERG